LNRLQRYAEEAEGLEMRAVASIIVTIEHYLPRLKSLTDLPLPDGEYWKKRCELSEAMYRKLNLNEYHGKEYEEWVALKQLKPIGASISENGLLREYFDLMDKSETEQHFEHLLQEHKWNERAKAQIELESKSTPAQEQTWKHVLPQPPKQ
jgi:hypothetical protein